MNCPKCEGEMWDNRGKKRNPKAPDFKCKDKNCDGVIWPPRNGKPSAFQQAKQSMEEPDEIPGIPNPPRNGGNGTDDRQNHIERQHSQEMALRFFALNGKVPTTKQLRQMISWFQRDISRPPEKEPAEVPNEEGEYPF